MTRQQAPEIVSASLQQNTSQALYFWKSFIRTNSWRRRLLCKKHYSTFSQSIFTLRCKNSNCTYVLPSKVPSQVCF